MIKHTALGLLLTAVACAGPTKVDDRAARSPQSPIKACELLTLDEADPQGANLLSPVGNAVDQSVGSEIAKCAYGTADLPVKVVSIEVRRFRDAEAAASAQRAARGMLRGLAGEEPHAVPGIGDDAVWAGGRLGQLHLQAGDLRLIVSVEVGDEGGREAQAKAIALRALERLRAASAGPAAPS